MSNSTPIITYTEAVCEPVYPGELRVLNVAMMPDLSVAAGEVLAEVTAAGANEVQTLNFSAGADAPTGGTFTLAVEKRDGSGTVVSPALAYNISNADLKLAIEALFAAAGYDGVTVTLTNGPAPADVTVTFSPKADIPLMTAEDSALTGGEGATVSLAVDATTAGVATRVWGKYSDAANDGRQVARGIARRAFRTDNQGNVVLGDSAEYGVTRLTAEVHTKGVFRTAELTGLDANAVADLGRLIRGTATDGLLVLA